MIGQGFSATLLDGVDLGKPKFILKLLELRYGGPANSHPLAGNCTFGGLA